jgi:putative peptide zinc metalloprotease protein
MLCATCRRPLAPATVCGTCGTPAPGATAPLELVLADGTRVPIVGDLTIGRSRANALCLDDPSVSRSHARILTADPGSEPLLEDAGSSYGTFVDDARVTVPVVLRSGARLQIGNQALDVEAQRAEHEAGRTIVVPVGASLLLPAVGPASLQRSATSNGQRPRLRSGYAIKRLDASEGERRWVVRDLHGDSFLRVSDSDQRLLALLDGTRSLADLVAESERAFGSAGVPRLARLLADLGERGMLAGVDASTEIEEAVAQSRWRQLLRPRERTVEGLGSIFGWIYRHGGWLLFARPALVAIAALGVVGIASFVALVVGRYGTPFVVADRLVIGGLVFLAGRALLVGFHELAHGLAMEAVGRRVRRAGLKLILVFPYAFVDTSEVWFEPRRRRLLVTIAGPMSDFAIAGLFSIVCLVMAKSTLREVLFQVAFGGYVAAFFNLNPFIERDGYHIVADRLGVPALRARARVELRRRLAGTATEPADPALMRYALAGIAWSFVMVAIAVAFSLRFQPTLVHYAPATVVWIVLGTVWFAAFVPVLIVVAPPLLERLRSAPAETEAEAVAP